MKLDQEEGIIEEMSINSVYLNNKWLLVTAQLETQVGGHAINIPLLTPCNALSHLI